MVGLALAGWLVAIGALIFAGFIQSRATRHRCQVEQPTRAVLVNASGLPESIRTLRNGIAPVTYSRPRGKNPAQIYHRIGIAAIYQTKDA